LIVSHNVNIVIKVNITYRESQPLILENFLENDGRVFCASSETDYNSKTAALELFLVNGERCKEKANRRKICDAYSPNSTTRDLDVIRAIATHFFRLELLQTIHLSTKFHHGAIHIYLVS
jgi:hypothetical protein